jgi:hypothetical protein
MLRAFYLWYLVRDVRTIEAARRRAGVPRLSEVDLHAYKRSDTLFVLSSGASINDISEERWAGIAKHDSAGFNFWLVHPFVPTYYFLEVITRSDASGAFEPFVSIANERAAAYRRVPKIAMELWKRGEQTLPHFSAEFRRNMYAAYNLPLPARTEEELVQGLRYLASRGWLQPEPRFSALLKYAASLTTMLIFALKLGYRRVVLCGTDLRHSDYFYHDAARYPVWANFNRPTSDTTVHATELDFAWHVPVSRAVYVMNRELLKPAGIALYIENTNSALYPALPIAGPDLFT